MTLRQVLDVLWKQKWIIVAVVVVALVTAVAYLQLRTETFESSGTVRLNAVVTDAAYAGAIGDVAVEVDPDIIRSPAVLDPAADSLGEDSSTLGAAISIDVDADTRLAQLLITAQGLSPSEARDRATAVMTAYQAYVDTQITDALLTLQRQQQAATADARDLQQQLADNPGDSVANANLQTALQQMTSVTATINSVNNGGANTIVLRPAGDGSSTVASPLIVLLLALVTGLVIGIAVALIRDQFDNRLRGEDEVASVTDVRSVGELSWDRNLAKMDPPLPVASNERTDLSERLRTLRSNLAVFLPPRDAAFVVTSVEPGEGKSFVAANLALAWARAGKKVILVGGDLRRPNLATYFGDAADGEGFSDILQEHEVGEELSHAAVDSRLNPTRFRRLLVLPSGPEPAEPADLFAQPIVAEIIEYLRKLADVVVIDSPPAMGMADAALLASHTDGAIVLASVRRTDRVQLLETIEALRSAGTEVLGVVTNRSRRKLPKTYSSYYITGQRGASTEQAVSLSPAPDDAAYILDDGFDDEEAPLRRDRPITSALDDDVSSHVSDDDDDVSDHVFDDDVSDDDDDFDFDFDDDSAATTDERADRNERKPSAS